MDFFIAISVGLFFSIFALIISRYPPKKISWGRGYNSRRAMANQVIWKLANELAAKMMLVTGLITLLISFLLYWFLPSFTVLIISCFILLLSILPGFFWCESQLDKHFDKKGNPKPKT